MIDCPFKIGDRVKYSARCLQEKRDYWQAHRDSTTAKAWYDEAAARRGVVTEIKPPNAWSRVNIIRLSWDDATYCECLPDSLTLSEGGPSLNAETVNKTPSSLDRCGTPAGNDAPPSVESADPGSSTVQPFRLGKSPIN